MAIILMIKSENGELAELPLLFKMTFGRSSSTDFKINDSKMSGKHCTLEVTPKGEILFTDLGSTNGSFVNNSRITKVLVKVADVIVIGNTTITIDEKRLSIAERKAIGYGVTAPAKNVEKTLPDLSNIKPKNEEFTTKKSVVLNKDIKNKKKDVNAFGASDNVLEQEESSGYTKMLKLENLIKKKK
jgi:pSer/pThr/pTyr-binding forkhead associated (FHA) protein